MLPLSCFSLPDVKLSYRKTRHAAALFMAIMAKRRSKDIARKNIKAFEDLNVDFIITNAGGCGAFLVEYDHLLHDDPEFKDRAVEFKKKIKDISEILVSVKFHEKIKMELPDQVITYQGFVPFKECDED